jgi:hypothetical protein
VFVRTSLLLQALYRCVSYFCAPHVYTAVKEYTLWSSLCNAAGVYYLRIIEMFVLLLLCVCTAIHATVLEQYEKEETEIAIWALLLHTVHSAYTCNVFALYSCSCSSNCLISCRVFIVTTSCSAHKHKDAAAATVCCLQTFVGQHVYRPTAMYKVRGRVI